MIRQNLLAYFELVPAEQTEYLWALEAVEQLGLPGGKVYDALLIGCAKKVAADRIYTFNLADFRLLAPPELLERVTSP